MQQLDLPALVCLVWAAQEKKDFVLVFNVCFLYIENSRLPENVRAGGALMHNTNPYPVFVQVGLMLKVCCLIS